MDEATRIFLRFKSSDLERLQGEAVVERNNMRLRLAKELDNLRKTRKRFSLDLGSDGGSVNVTIPGTPLTLGISTRNPTTRRKRDTSSTPPQPKPPSSSDV